jgi:hypothetical protein
MNLFRKLFRSKKAILMIIALCILLLLALYYAGSEVNKSLICTGYYINEWTCWNNDGEIVIITSTPLPSLSSPSP